MDSLKPQLPKISNEDRTPLVDVLLELLAWQQIQIDKLEQEILKLKGETTKPKIKPSKMDEGSSAENSDVNGDDGDKPKKNKGPKRSKTEHLKIDATFNCDSFSYAIGKRTPIVELVNTQIVNGGQTSNALFEASQIASEKLEDVLVLVRIIETKSQPVS